MYFSPRLFFTSLTLLLTDPNLVPYHTPTFPLQQTLQLTPHQTSPIQRDRRTIDKRSRPTTQKQTRTSHILLLANPAQGNAALDLLSERL